MRKIGCRMKKILMDDFTRYRIEVSRGIQRPQMLAQFSDFSSSQRRVRLRGAFARGAVAGMPSGFILLSVLHSADGIGLNPINRIKC